MGEYLPKGFRDYLFDRADTLERVQNTVGEVFRRWGYRRLVPSAVEDEETLRQGAGEALRRESFRFADRSGEIMALRPDLTLQSARVIAGELAAYPPPIRLFYSERVFRNRAEHTGELREVWQAGAELAGVEGPEADAEIIAVGLEALLQAGYDETQLQVDLGHAGFVNGVFAALQLDTAASASVAAVLKRKDERAMRDLRDAGVVSDDAFRVLSKMLGAFGLRSMNELLALNLPGTEEAAADLQGIATVFSAYGITAEITLDPGDVGGLDYYTGFFFHIYHKELARPLAMGGRYDNLIGQYGRALPAVGCALDIGLVAESVTGQPSRQVHIVNYRSDRGAALELARVLRNAGIAASRDIVRRSESESLAFADANGIDSVVFVDQDGIRLTRLGKQSAFKDVTELVKALG